MAFLFAGFVGVILFRVLPRVAGRQLNPIEALRYE